MTLTRRVFLQTAAACLGVSLLDRTSTDLEKIFAHISANLLEMINEERAVEKVQPLAFDELATQVATKHAIEMAREEFASHWGRDGLKPYHRYSFAGGTHATQENVSAADSTWSMKVDQLKQDAAYLHVRLYQQKPPYDGHRKTILAPQHTHVGIGLAVEQLRLRLVELFVAKHVEVAPMAREAKPGDEINFRGKILTRDHELNNLEVFYEPLPTAPELSWLRQTRAYALPQESRVLRPRLLPPLMYADKRPGTVNVSPDGSFSSPIRLFSKEPGIYTIVAWIRRSKAEKSFAATEVCIRAQ
ncbi:MAG TPA: CAP domain-containing protein [Pyrinomonadaceae bacterium]|nr:CAP domain-containing protein [Pyrinomonadaceae bacterium]